MFNSIERAIGNALLTGDSDLAIAKVRVQSAVVRRMFCQRCNNVLDQRSAAVMELHEEGSDRARETFVMCGQCTNSEEFNSVLKRRVAESAHKLGLKTRIHTWSGTKEVTLDDEDQPDPRQVELPLNHED